MWSASSRQRCVTTISVCVYSTSSYRAKVCTASTLVRILFSFWQFTWSTGHSTLFRLISWYTVDDRRARLCKASDSCRVPRVHQSTWSRQCQTGLRGIFHVCLNCLNCHFICWAELQPTLEVSISFAWFYFYSIGLHIFVLNDCFAT